MYAVLQIGAEAPVVAAARVHGNRLQELRDETLGKPGKLDPPDFARVDELVREARHTTVEAMRSEFGLADRADLTGEFNAFSGTDLESRYVSTAREGRPDAGLPPGRRV